MASNLKYNYTLRAVQQTAINTTLSTSAILEIYSGTQPTDPDTADSVTLLATLTCSATFGTVSGSAHNPAINTAGTITSGTGTAGAGGGTAATHFRLKLPANAGAAGLAIIDGTVGISGCDLNLNNTSIATGQTVSCTSCVFTNGNQ